MTTLSRPDVALCENWSEAVLDYGTEVIHGSGMWHRPEAERLDVSRSGCATFVSDLLSRGDVSVPPGEGLVHSDYFWLTDAASEVVGFLALRHRLNEWLLEEGGHIGYSVRPSRRREGHASRALQLALERAGVLGIERALVTCDEDNIASRQTIESNDGAYEDSRRGKRRYWCEPASGR